MEEGARNEGPEGRLSLANLFERLMLLPSVLGFVVALAALLAVSHDVAYFWYVDINFLSFLTTSDLVKSTAGWMPLTVPVGVFAVFVSRTMGTEAPFLKLYISENLMTASAWSMFWLMVKRNKFSVLSVVFFLYIMIFQVSYQFCLMFFVFTAVLLATLRAVNRNFARVQEVFLKSKYAAASALMIAASLFGSALGWADGAGDLRATSPVYKLKSDGIDSPLVLVVRSGEKGVIYRQSSTIGFVPWDNIKSLSRIYPPMKIESLPKHIYRWFTDKPLSPP